MIQQSSRWDGEKTETCKKQKKQKANLLRSQRKQSLLGKADSSSASLDNWKDSQGGSEGYDQRSDIMGAAVLIVPQHAKAKQ